jgi:hypothetical protein
VTREEIKKQAERGLAFLEFVHGPGVPVVRHALESIRKGALMIPFEITYRVGVYHNSIIIQAEDEADAKELVGDRHLIPEGGVIVRVEARS